MGELNTEHDGKLADELADMAYAQNRCFTAQKELNGYPTDKIPNKEYDVSSMRAVQTEWDLRVATRDQEKAYEKALEALADDETIAGDELIQKYIETIHLFSDIERSWLLEKMLVLREKLIPGEVFFFNNTVMTVAGTPNGDASVAKPQLAPVADYRGRPYQRLVWCVSVEGSVESVLVDEQEIVVGRQEVKDALGRYQNHNMSFSEFIGRAQDYGVVGGERESKKYRLAATDRAIRELQGVYTMEPTTPGDMLTALESVGAMDMFVSELTERLARGRAGTMSIIYSRVVRVLVAYEKSKLADYKGMALMEIPVGIEEVLSLYRKLQSPVS